MTSRWVMQDGVPVLVFDDEETLAQPGQVAPPEQSVQPVQLVQPVQPVQPAQSTPTQSTPAPVQPVQPATTPTQPAREVLEPKIIAPWERSETEPEPEPEPKQKGPKWKVGWNIQNILGASLARRPTVEIGGSAPGTPDFAALLRVPANAVTGFGQSIVDLLQRDIPQLLGYDADQDIARQTAAARAQTLGVQRPCLLYTSPSPRDS